MPLAIEGAVVRDMHLAIDFLRHAQGDAALGERVSEPVGIIAVNRLGTGDRDRHPLHADFQPARLSMAADGSDIPRSRLIEFTSVQGRSS